MAKFPCPECLGLLVSYVPPDKSVKDALACDNCQTWRPLASYLEYLQSAQDFIEAYNDYNNPSRSAKNARESKRVGKTKQVL